MDGKIIPIMNTNNLITSYTTDTNNVCRGNINPMTDITRINQPICPQNSEVLWVAKIIGNSTNIRNNTRFSASNQVQGLTLDVITDSTIDSYNSPIFVGYFSNNECDSCSDNNRILEPDFIIAYNSDGNIGGKILSSGHLDAIIAKYDTSGFLQWITKISGVSNESTLRVTVDRANNIIITGTYFSFRPFIYNTNGQVALVLPDSCGYTSFVVKYDPFGNVLWSNIIISSNRIIIRSIITDLTNNIYIIGSYNGSNIKFLNINGTAGTTLPDSVNNDIFLAKYSQNGNVQWSTKLSGTSLDIGYDIAVISDGSIIITGCYNSTTLSLYNTPNGSILSDILLVNDKNTNAFLAKYSPMGVAIWAIKLENISGIGTKVAIDNSSNIILLGSYHLLPAILYNCNNTNRIDLVTCGQYNAFVAKIDQGGNPLWTTRISGNRNDFILDLATDNHNNILITGSYSSPSIIVYNSDGSTGPRLSNSGSVDAFIIKYNTFGRALWATKQSGASVDRGTSVSADSNDDIIGTGFFFSPKLFLQNSNGSISKILINNEFNRNISYLVKYINYGQVLRLSPALAIEHTKNIILDEYHGFNTLIEAGIGILYDINNRMARGIILSNSKSNVILKWCHNRWTVVSGDFTVVY